jgi:hypothetical protein
MPLKTSKNVIKNSPFMLSPPFNTLALYQVGPSAPPAPSAFTINRSTWVRGTKCEDSFLLVRSTGLKCCLGFYSLACGHTEKEITNHSFPGDMVRANGGTVLPGMRMLIDSTSQGTVISSETAFDIAQINDDWTISEEDRERRIIEAFAQHGVTANIED